MKNCGLLLGKSASPSEGTHPPLQVHYENMHSCPGAPTHPIYELISAEFLPIELRVTVQL